MLATRHAQLVSDFEPIEDPQERLTLILDRAKRRPTVPPAARTEENRVHGCVSAVWITAQLYEGRLRLFSHADSALVHGLVSFLCELYDDAPPADILATPPTVLDQLGLLRDLSPTRRNGLAAVHSRIRELAQAALPNQADAAR